jgi:hypothetical protein
VDHTGKPIQGARVQAVPTTSYTPTLSNQSIVGPAEWFTAVTDERGVFRLSQFAADVNTFLHVHAPDRNCTYEFAKRYINGFGFEVWHPNIRLMLPQEGNIKGRVVEAGTGKPVGNLTLAIQRVYSGSEIINRYHARTVVAGPDGTFVCEGLPEGKHSIAVANPDDENTQWVAPPMEVSLDLDRPMDDVEFALQKGGIIEYVVRDSATRDPLARMDVSARKERFHTSSATDEEKKAGHEPFYARSTTDKQGKARIRVPKGEYRVYVYTPRYAGGQLYESQRWNEPVVVQKGEISRVDARFDKAPRLEGLVIDTNGRPANDVRVSVQPCGIRTHGGETHVHTDGNGRFVTNFDKTCAEKGFLVIARDSKRSLACVMRTNEFDKPLRLALGPALTVKGRVTDPNGGAVKAARVSLRGRYDVYVIDIGAEELTDSKGHFEFDAVPLKHGVLDHRIVVHAAGFGSKTLDKISIEGQPGATVELPAIQLEPADASISGTVVDAEGLPAANVPIYLNHRLSWEGSHQPDKNTVTDEEGRFAIRRICRIPARLQANYPTSPGGMGNLRATGGDKDVKIILGEDRTHVSFVSLIDKPLPELAVLNVKLSPVDTDGKMILLCFLDVEQRPSRNTLRLLSEKAPRLAAKGIAVVAVQASKIDESSPDEWGKRYNISFPLAMIPGNSEKTRFAWGVRSLPWLILTDTDHTVTAAGFGLSELDAKVKALD